MPDLRVSLAGVELKNPIVVASGTYGFGHEYGEFYDLSELGAICVKGLTPVRRDGNPPPRIAETPAWVCRIPVWMLLSLKKCPFCGSMM